MAPQPKISAPTGQPYWNVEPTFGHAPRNAPEPDFTKMAAATAAASTGIPATGLFPPPAPPQQQQQTAHMTGVYNGTSSTTNPAAGPTTIPKDRADMMLERLYTGAGPAAEEGADGGNSSLQSAGALAQMPWYHRFGSSKKRDQLEKEKNMNKSRRSSKGKKEDGATEGSMEEVQQTARFYKVLSRRASQASARSRPRDSTTSAAAAPAAAAAAQAANLPGKAADAGPPSPITHSKIPPAESVRLQELVDKLPANARGPLLSLLDTPILAAASETARRMVSLELTDLVWLIIHFANNQTFWSGFVQPADVVELNALFREWLQTRIYRQRMTQGDAGPSSPSSMASGAAAPKFAAGRWGKEAATLANNIDKAEQSVTQQVFRLVGNISHKIPLSHLTLIPYTDLTDVGSTGAIRLQWLLFHGRLFHSLTPLTRAVNAWKNRSKGSSSSSKIRAGSVTYGIDIKTYYQTLSSLEEDLELGCGNALEEAQRDARAAAAAAGDVLDKVSTEFQSSRELQWLTIPAAYAAIERLVRYDNLFTRFPYVVPLLAQNEHLKSAWLARLLMIQTVLQAPAAIEGGPVTEDVSRFFNPDDDSAKDILDSWQPLSKYVAMQRTKLIRFGLAALSEFSTRKLQSPLVHTHLLYLINRYYPHHKTRKAKL